jgi:hypothetical protein
MAQPGQAGSGIDVSVDGLVVPILAVSIIVPLLGLILVFMV